MDPISGASTIVEFGRFRVLPHRRELLADGRPIRVGGRAFDVLLALIEAQRAIVDKDALMRRVWPNRVVEENNLQAQISALRNVFGVDRELIRTISGRGYQFGGEIRVLASGGYPRSAADASSARPVLARPPTNLPEAVSELIGRDAEREMQLYAALGASLMYTRGVVPEIGTAWGKALEIAETLRAVEFQLRALWGLWSYHISSGQYSVALTLARRFCKLAEDRPDPADQLIGDRLIGVSQHYLGDQPNARRHIERMLDRYLAPVQRSHIIRFQTDQRVTARVFLARILWLQGFPDQAMRIARSNIVEARAGGHAMSLCYALSTAACPLALLTGDLNAAEHYVTMLVDHSARHALGLWRAWGRSFEGVLVIARGDVITGLRLLREGFDELGEARSALRFITFLGYLAEGLARVGQIDESVSVIDQAIDRSEHTEERWRIAELLRIKGEVVLLQNTPGTAMVAEQHFRQALSWAGRQGRHRG